MEIWNVGNRIVNTYIYQIEDGYIMIDKAIVNRDKSIEFIFNSGYKVKVEARK